MNWYLLDGWTIINLDACASIQLDGEGEGKYFIRFTTQRDTFLKSFDTDDARALEFMRLYNFLKHEKNVRKDFSKPLNDDNIA